MVLPLAVAAALAAGAAGDRLQVFASPTFERFAAATDAACPVRGLRYVTPGDLDLIEEDFIAAQRRRVRHRISAVDAGPARCAGRDGLSCPTMATLDAFAATGTLDRFAVFACAAPGS